LNVHPATSAHGVGKGANQLLQHQTVLPTIAFAISLIVTRCLACSWIRHNAPLVPPHYKNFGSIPSEFCNEKNGETANELPVIKGSNFGLAEMGLAIGLAIGSRRRWNS